MAISWSALGKDSPLIRGIPAQFDSVDASFGQIASLTRHLSHDLHEIRMGQSDGFAGEAANALHGVIGEIYTGLSDVPRIATDISVIFRDHSTSLSELRKEAESALARAQTRWNDKCQAEDEIDSCRSRLRSLRSQISALDGSSDPETDDAKSRLESRHSSIRVQLGRAERDLDKAREELEHSRNEWDRIRRDEDDLNEYTKRRITGLQLWSLTDTGNWLTEGAANFFGGLADAIGEIWDYLAEHVLQDLLNFLDSLLDWLGVLDLVLGFIPIVGQVIMLIEATIVSLKALAGLALVLQGRMDLSVFLWSTAIDFAGVVPGVPRFMVKAVAKTGMKAARSVTRAAGRSAARTTERVSDGIAEAVEVTEGAVPSIALKGTGRVVKKGHNVFADFGRKWFPRHAPISWERQIRFKGSQIQRQFSTMGDNIHSEALRRGRQIRQAGRHDAAIIRERFDNLADAMSSEVVDFVPNEIWDKGIMRGLEYGRERALQNSSKPIQDGQYPVLESCELDTREPVAA